MLRPLNKFDPPELVRGRDAPSDKDTLLKLLLPLNILRLLAGAVAGRDINRGHDEVLRRELVDVVWMWRCCVVVKF